MGEQNLSINLRMVSVPEGPAASHFAPADTKPPAAFDSGRFLKQLGILVVIAVLSLGCYISISRCLVQTIEVVGESMLPTLQPGNHYILNRWAFHGTAPQRGDVVVIPDPADHGHSVKRVI